jgi:hypothetical protein
MKPARSPPLTPLLFAPLLGLLAGCQGTIRGDWHLVDAKPNRQTFSIDNATFRPDGTYAAMTMIEGVTTNEKGTYDFDGFKLQLRPQGGGQRTYTVHMEPGQMRIGDSKRNVTLQKGRRGP